jgi:hypothetical protein
MSADDTLSPGQRHLLVALLQVGNVADACRRAGVGRKTFYRWLRLPAFRAELSKLQDAALSEAVHAAVSRMGAALDCLAEVAASPTVNPSARVSAASAILAHAIRLYETESLLDRIRALEERMAKGEHTSGTETN